MFNKTRVRLQCFIVSFFKVRLPISIKRLCAWLNIFSKPLFFHSQSDKARYSCIVFLCASSFLSSPTLLLHITRRRGLLGL